MKARTLCWLLIFVAAYVLGALHRPAWLIALSVFAIWLLGRTWQFPRGATVMLGKLWREGHYAAALRFWLYLVWLGIEGYWLQMHQYRRVCRELPAVKKGVLL